MKKLIIILGFFPFLSIAQNVKGTVIDVKSKLPIEGVDITLKRLNIRTITNEKGDFTLKKPKTTQENDTLYFSNIGYVTKKISLSDLQKNDFSVFLDENIEQLNNITVSATKPLKSKIAYTKLAPLKYALFSFGSILKDNKIYVIGGDASFKTDAFKKVRYENANSDTFMDDYLKELRFQFSGQSYNGNLLIYDLKTDQWETSTIKFRKRAYLTLNEHNDKIYVIGGKRVSVNGVFEYLDDKIEVFDTKKQTIAIDNTNPHQAAGPTSFTHNDNIIVMGGSVKMSEDGTKEYSNKVHSYDTNSGYWYQLADMPTAKETNGILIKDKIYLIGGFNGNPLSIIESFDVRTEKWVTEGELFYGLCAPAITQNGGIIFFFENEKIYTYDTNAKLLKEYLINLPMKASKLFFSNNKLYLLGGSIENYYSTYPSPGFFSIDINEFENTKPNRSKIL